MYIDFENLDFDLLKTKFSNDEYYSRVIDFLEKYLFQDYFVSHTSGSTGIPKELRIDKNRANESARLSNQYFEINNLCHLLLCLDIRFIGSKLMLVRAHLAKAKVKILKPSLQFYKEVVNEDFDFISLTPLHVSRILEETPKFFSRIKKCLIGSSAVSFELEKRLKLLETHTIFYESYAMTETISHFALRNISLGETSFATLSGFEISMTEEDCLEIYHPTIIPEKIKTNDVVAILDDKHLVYKGRKDNVINSGGIKINPESIESEWSQFLPFEFILAGIPENTLGQQLIMIVKTPATISKSEIYQRLKEREIPSRMQPKEIWICTDWIQTESLKPKRKEIFDNRIVWN